jgi:hypothetical protein
LDSSVCHYSYTGLRLIGIRIVLQSDRSGWSVFAHHGPKPNRIVSVGVSTLFDLESCLPRNPDGDLRFQ